MRRPMAVIQIPTNSETSKIRMKTPMKHCYSKSYSPESSLDYERRYRAGATNFEVIRFQIIVREKAENFWGYDEYYHELR